MGRCSSQEDGDKELSGEKNQIDEALKNTQNLVFSCGVKSKPFALLKVQGDIESISEIILVIGLDS